MYKKVYFIGIGGISMSGLARILRHNGTEVFGSDRDESLIVDELKSEGITVYIGHSAKNITPDLDLVVYTAAISNDNPELLQAQKYGLKIISRAELLGHIMEGYQKSITVCGTHGKTTTTSMIASILMDYTDPTVTVGGILHSTGSNVVIGNSDYFVAEACEYTNSFFSFFPKYNVILNIEEDHPDFFADLADIRNSFRHFAQNTKDDGVVFINDAIDAPEEITAGCRAKIVTFGFDDKSDFYAANLKNNDGYYSFTPIHKGTALGTITLSIPGRINVINALGAISICHHIGVPFSNIAAGLKSFTGAQRRFDKKGEYNGAVIIDDYAHHPTEVAATIAAAREVAPKRLVVYFQPHTYSRLKALLDDFIDALCTVDLLLVADVYAAREKNTFNISSEMIVKGACSKGCNAIYLPDTEEGIKYLKKNLIHGDMLITMGAGNIYFVADKLLEN